MNTLEILDALVGFDTTSSKSNRALVEWVRDHLAGLGVEYRIDADGTGEKLNLLARVGPEVAGGVVLCGHSDVVPVDGQTWRTPPFRLTRQGDRVFGRGSCDMKGFLASVLGAVPGFMAADLARPVYVAMTYDEEIGCFGAHAMIETAFDGLPRPAAVIVGEPTSMAVIDRHPGAHAERIRFEGRAGHSSRPEGLVSAVDAALEFLSALKAAASRADLAEDGLVLNLASIRGGTAHNIVAGEVVAEWSARFRGRAAVTALIDAAQAQAATLQAKMRAVDPQCGVRSDVLLSIPALLPEPDGAAVALCTALTGSNATLNAPYGTEAGLFQQAGLSTAVCGPGSIDQAHGADEFVEIDQLDRCDLFLDALGHTLRAS